MRRQAGHLRPAFPLVLGRAKAIAQRCNWLVEKGIKLAEKPVVATRLGTKARRLKNETLRVSVPQWDSAPTLTVINTTHIAAGRDATTKKECPYEVEVQHVH